ncbi:putative RNA-editing complex protein MP81 [Trypanosoma rangeli]|uniref:Putative RNA-editing complex protein MP81 n=1 Tax=Trypanosoma rangeli TaxID=5698 RepID=A0A3R7NTD7_TRYRA|nr:putative RNA-editing complex protein MP81 [Trypanosoma rangeli]RNF07364.1 putative RNA-editing complex protein MP81 [Trypanosoma rangeli]|eukprot:RNF07364.1 putative RNA-editing complex protein MP81 [Trypanosoma rangeli]
MRRFAHHGGRRTCPACGGCRKAGTLTGPALNCWRRASRAPLLTVHSSYALMTLHNGAHAAQQAGTAEQTSETPAKAVPLSSSTSSSSVRNPYSLAAGDASHATHTDASASAPASFAGEARELQFHEIFLFDETDVHFLLLTEAHKKHGVLLNVPPQMSPSGESPAVPEVVLPAAQLERMRGMKLAYEPTHLPPPLHTTGTRQLVICDAFPTVATVVAMKPTATSAHAATTRGTAGKGGTSTATLVRRLPPDPTMRFHCTACGKAFRLEFSAEHHVRSKHPAESRAVVAAGPGEGEVIEEAAATIVTSAAAVSPVAETKSTVMGAVEKGGTTASDIAAAGSVGTASGVSISAVKTPYSRAVLTLPSEELVDELLKEVWDAVAQHRDDLPKQNDPNAYVPFHTVVEGTADRRKEMEANAKPTARATPEGAAPGIKKQGMLSGGSMTALRSAAAGLNLPIKELVKKYPNPFGDSPNAVLQELEKEPINPFIPQEELAAQLQVARETQPLTATATAETNSDAAAAVGDGEEELKKRLRVSRPSLARSASMRRFVCPLCAEVQRKKAGACGEMAVPSFRLLDALLDHVESAHEGEELTEAQLHVLYAIQRRSALHAPPPSLDGEAGGAGGTAGNFGADVLRGDDASGSGSEETIHDLKIASLPETLQKAAPPAAVEHQALQVHLRAGSNTVLLGRIADVQHGFLGTMAVTQYVLEVEEEGPAADAGAEGTASLPATESELIVVRCMGDNFPAALLKEQVRLGSTVLVQGTLRMNRHLDNASKRIHAYPFVQVVPPLGCVKVVA